MKKLYEKCLSYSFINGLIMIICLLDLISVALVSGTLLKSTDSAYFLEALAQLPFLPIVYGILVAFNILLIILSLIRWRRNPVNKMYLTSSLFGVLMLLIGIHVFPLVRLTYYAVFGQVQAIGKMTLKLNEAALMNRLMSMLFALIISGFLAIAMLMMALVVYFQIKGKLYFPRREEDG